eukprot:10674292-Karenia_brevis.AAC.1
MAAHSLANQSKHVWQKDSWDDPAIGDGPGKEDGTPLGATETKTRTSWADLSDVADVMHVDPSPEHDPKSRPRVEEFNNTADSASFEFNDQ